MAEATKNNIMSVLKEFTRIIKLNNNKTLPSELDNNKTLPSELDNNLNLLTKCLEEDKFDQHYAYTDLLAQFNEYIDHCNIDSTKIKKSIFDQIKKYYNTSNPSDIETNSYDNISENDEDKNNDDDNDNDDENNEDENKVKNNIKMNDLLYDKIMNNLNIALEKAITSNNEELMNHTIKLMNTLTSNQINNTNNTNNIKNNINNKIA